MLPFRVLTRNHLRTPSRSFTNYPKHFTAAQLASNSMDYQSRLKKENEMAILDNTREAEVLEKVRGKVQNPDYAETIVATFADMMAQSRRYQKRQLEG